MLPRALIIVGPTAIGKSGLAEDIASTYQLPIISADSRQLFKELKIGVARPEDESLEKHRYIEIGSVSIHKPHNVFSYCQRVKDFLSSYKGDVIVAGGTGFYVNALLHGLEELPKRDDQLRMQLKNLFDTGGIQALQERYRQLDNPYPVSDPLNPQRLMRAIEMGTQRDKKRLPPVLEGYQTSLLALDMPRDLLYQRINQRVDIMMQRGLLDEVKGLQTHQHLEALQTVGYSELFEYLNGSVSLEQAIDQIKKHSRNYAKRQFTYFRNKLTATWIDVADRKKINTFVSNFLS